MTGKVISNYPRNRACDELLGNPHLGHFSREPFSASSAIALQDFAYQPLLTD